MFTHSLEFLFPCCLWPPSIPLLLALDLAAGWRHGRLLGAGCGQLATDGHPSWPRLLLLLTASCRWLLNTYSTHIPTSNKHTRDISTLPLLYYFLRCDGISRNTRTLRQIFLQNSLPCFVPTKVKYDFNLLHCQDLRFIQLYRHFFSTDKFKYICYVITTDIFYMVLCFTSFYILILNIKAMIMDQHQHDYYPE